MPRRKTRGCTSFTRVPLKDLRSRELAAAARASAVTFAAAGETAAAAASAGGSSSEGTTNSSALDLQKEMCLFASLQGKHSLTQRHQVVISTGPWFLFTTERRALQCSAYKASPVSGSTFTRATSASNWSTLLAGSLCWCTQATSNAAATPGRTNLRSFALA